MTKELEHQLRLERSRVDKRADELVAFLDIQREHQTVSVGCICILACWALEFAVKVIDRWF